MKCYSLFRGIGGFDLACQRKGIEIVGGCEIDRYANQIYEKNFGKKPFELDATKIKPEELPDFDLLCAGFPCQAFSVAGRRLGFKDTRGSLFFEIIRIAREKRPSILLLENVKGLLFHEKGKTLFTILQTLYDLGYDVEWQVINSKYFVPQNRERIFIIGHLREESRPKIFPFIANVKKTDGDEPKLNQLNNPRYSTNRVYDTDGIARTLRANSSGLSNTGVYAILTPQRKNKRQNGRRCKEIGEPSFTLTSQDIHGVYDGYKYRQLTPLECERLQGFPDGWTEGISDTQRYKCLGNAVTVPVVEYILERLVKWKWGFQSVKANVSMLIYQWMV